MFSKADHSTQAGKSQQGRILRRRIWEIGIKGKAMLKLTNKISSMRETYFTCGGQCLAHLQVRLIDQTYIVHDSSTLLSIQRYMVDNLCRVLQAGLKRSGHLDRSKTKAHKTLIHRVQHMVKSLSPGILHLWNKRSALQTALSSWLLHLRRVQR